MASEPPDGASALPPVRSVAADTPVERAPVAAPVAAPRGFSLLQRTALTLALSAVLIAGTAIAALEWLVVQPMSERWAADEAGLLELAARTWWQLPADARPDFELELAERHDLIISNAAAAAQSRGASGAAARRSFHTPGRAGDHRHDRQRA